MTTHDTKIMYAATPEDLAVRRALAILKQSVKADRPALRALKAERVRLAKAEHAQLAKPGTLGSGHAQWQMWKAKCDARARHLVYGLLRGQAWGRMESNRPEGDERFIPYVRQAWAAVRTAVTAETGTAPAPSETMAALGVK